VWARRLRETFVSITIGDGVIELIAPRQHSLLWDTGAQSVRKMARFSADNPKYMRFLGAAQICFGVWLGLRRYREE
jgi:hypothetical protein